MDLKLHPLQAALALVMLEDLRNEHWALLKAGQRGGKNIVAMAIAKQGAFKNIAVISGTAAQEESYINDLKGHLDPTVKFASGGVPTNSWLGLECTLVILDEAMWVPRSYDTFNNIREHKTNVLVISSRGPEYDKDIRWQTTRGYSANAWDLNPTLSQAFLQQNFDVDTSKAIRDFCAY